MGEIKSVKVDNWGVFFLQKLQNFFNKTDYCDLTLQFRDNSQLKVHRLVLSACTDYFNVLEQTCEVVDDALIMPNELQADVVVPIVNFMYTGTLEFELKMYGKLLRTAKEMNMTVLLKLLEAHRRTMEGVNRAQRPTSPKNIRKRVSRTSSPVSPQTRPTANSSQHQQQLQTRRILTSANTAPQRRLVQTKTIATSSSQPQVLYRQQIGSTSLLKTPSGGTSPIKIQRGTYETNYQESSTQLKQEHDEYESQVSTNQPPSPFEQLRKGYNNNKRPATASFISPPAKKPNIEDVKEFAEQQRMRKQIAAEYGEDQEYEGMLDDDIHNDDDDDETAVASSSTSAATSNSKQHQGPSIIIKQEPNEKPTIVVKDSSTSKMNHAKIISEVLRQYPHLVKGNKNIKLKIMPNAGGQAQKIIVKKEQIDNISAEMSTTTVPVSKTANQNQILQKSTTQQTLLKPVEKSQQSQQTRSQLTPSQRSSEMSCAPAAATTSTTDSLTTAPAQRRRIDSKTMHALIAQGAENTTGPWLCLRCGVNGRPISIPSYRGFRRHLINTHKETIDPALCEHCGWRSANNRELHFHSQVEHNILTTIYTFPKCLMCSEIFIDTNALNQHMVDSHPDENQQQCIYCNKIFAKEMQLYTHMKTYHKKQAIDDGIIDYSDDEDEDAMGFQEEEIEEEIMQEKPSSSSTKDKKIKILSDISLPSASSLIKLEPSSEAAALTTIASGIAASIGLETSDEFISTPGDADKETTPKSEISGEPKFVSADGNEMVLTEEQRKEIMSQLNQEHEGGVVMVLNESAFPEAIADVNEDTSQDGTVEQPDTALHTEDESTENAEGSPVEEDYDDSNIYNEFGNSSHTESKKESGLDESKGSIDNLEWAENLISAHDLEEDQSISKSKVISEVHPSEKSKTSAADAKSDEDISKKLKELTGDWSDDDEEEDEDVTKLTEVVPSTNIELNQNSIQKAEIELSKEKITAVDVGDEKIEKEPLIETEKELQQDPEGDMEPVEDDIEIALKSLHTEDVGTTSQSNLNEVHDTSKIDNNTSEENIDTDLDRNEKSTDELEKNDMDRENKVENVNEPVTPDASETLEPLTASIEETETILRNLKDDTVQTSTIDDTTEENQHNDVESSEAKKTLCEEIVEKGSNVEPKTNLTEVDKSNIEVGNTVNIAELEDHEKMDCLDSIPAEMNKAVEKEDATVEDSAVIEDSDMTSSIEPASTTPKTEDKVKTLISDWGDDEEEFL